MTILDIQNLEVTFYNKNNAIRAVDNISFNLHNGQCLAIVGESGSGKSVTALSILNLLKNSAICNLSGKIIFSAGQNLDKVKKEDNNITKHTDILALTEKQLEKIRGKEISMIFQEPLTALNPLHNIEKQISEIILLHNNIDKKLVRERVIELLKMVELDGLLGRLDAYPYQLSGGQRQRVMIAMAIANNPKILIADEPTTALDVTTGAEIIKLIKNLQQKTGLSIIFITHDLNIVKKIADKICVMQNGKIVETGSVTNIFDNPQNDYTKKLINSQIKGKAVPIEEDAPQLMNVNNLNVKFAIGNNFLSFKHRYNHIIKDFSFELKQGETLGIVGESGSGKTTIAMALLRLIKSQGQINFNGVDLNNLDGEKLRSLRSDMQIVFQDPFASLNPRMNVLQLIDEGLKAHNILKNQPNERTQLIKGSLREVGLEENMINRYPHEFSGGQRQRIAIARALALNPKLIILDEPTSALDVTVQVQIIQLLHSIQAKHKTCYICISHDLKVIRALSHRVIILEDGQIVESGDVGEIFANPANEYTRKLLEASSYK